MLFNSVLFLLFFVVVVLSYYILPAKWRWLFLLVASYYFYMNWKPIYALLIFLSTLTTYGSSILIARSSSKKDKTRYLVANLLINLGILFIYKYFNFVNQSVYALLDGLGLHWEIADLELLLPVGISFYTFQAIGYSIDVYKDRVEPEFHFGRYALFVSFFPQLVAGPIERASHLLPQFRQNFKFNSERLISGIEQMAWGFFMKVAVADRLAIYVNAVYNNVDKHNGSSFWLATVLFAFQIYCDFAGYSNIAIGAARIMGFDLMENFKRPYFAKSMSEFWGRWHISLSTWFRDYLYIPIGGNRVSYLKHLRNLMITFVISGVWHGANWTFVWWGVFHGTFLCAQVIIQKIRKSNNDKLSTQSAVIRFVDGAINILFTFFLVNITWVLFRANSIFEAQTILYKMCTDFGPLFLNKTVLSYGIISLMLLIIKELNDEFNLGLNLLTSNNMIVKGVSIAFVIYMVVLLGVEDSDQFIYFQF